MIILLTFIQDKQNDVSIFTEHDVLLLLLLSLYVCGRGRASLCAGDNVEGDVVLVTYFMVTMSKGMVCEATRGAMTFQVVPMTVVMMMMRENKATKTQ